MSIPRRFWPQYRFSTPGLTRTAAWLQRPREASSVTKASAVHDQRRADILGARLEPGTRLRIEFVCERYRARNAPVREALNRLVAEGLLQRQEQRGFVVTPMSADELDELIRTRSAIETLALRESLARRDATWEQQLVLARHRLEHTPRSLREDHFEANPDWELRHREFHRALIAACQSRWLRRFRDELADHAYRSRHRSMVAAWQRRDVVGKHAYIAVAAIGGDVERALALRQAHNGRTGSGL